jgi:hypothetical protein
LVDPERTVEGCICKLVAGAGAPRQYQSSTVNDQRASPEAGLTLTA